MPDSGLLFPVQTTCSTSMGEVLRTLSGQADKTTVDSGGVVPDERSPLLDVGVGRSPLAGLGGLGGVHAASTTFDNIAAVTETDSLHSVAAAAAASTVGQGLPGVGVDCASAAATAAAASTVAGGGRKQPAETGKTEAPPVAASTDTLHVDSRCGTGSSQMELLTTNGGGKADKKKRRPKPPLLHFVGRFFGVYAYYFKGKLELL